MSQLGGRFDLHFEAATNAFTKADNILRAISEFTFIDLFAGIGGFHLGLRANGGKCVYSNEWNRYASKTYQAWTGHSPDNSDIREVDIKKDIPPHDVLAAGFPCQPFSLAGVSKKNSLGRDHGFKDLDQGNLFFAICDILEAHKPKVVLLENVKNLRSHDKGNTWNVIVESLSQIGYHVTWSIIDAKNWVPQHRERVFIVALRKDLWTADQAEAFPFPSGANLDRPKLADVLETEPEKKYMLTPRLWEYLQEYAEKHRALGNGFGYSLANKESHSRTLSARYHKDGSEILIDQAGWERPRRLTPREARNLMGFTEDIALAAGVSANFEQVVSDTQAYRQFGNSVCPLIVRDIGEGIVRYLDGN